MELLILAARDPKAVLPTVTKLAELLTVGDSSFAGSEEFQAVRPRSYPVDDDPHFVPITDQKPFLAGNVRYILSMTQVVQLFGLAGGVLGLAGAAVWWGLRRRDDPRIEGRPFSAVASLALLIGANFLMMEHTLVLILFRRLYVYDDALGMGAIGFLTLSGLGSLVAVRRLRPAFAIAAIISMGFFLVHAERLSLSGSPPRHQRPSHWSPATSSRRRVRPGGTQTRGRLRPGCRGGWLGALLATFIPIAWGIDTFILVSGAVFLLTVLADACFHRHLGWPQFKTLKLALRHNPATGGLASGR